MTLQLSPGKPLSRRMKILILLAVLLLTFTFVSLAPEYDVFSFFFSPIILAVILIQLNRQPHAGSSPG